MPRVGELNNCKIYKITSLNNPEVVYYGHTCQTLSSRYSKHKTLSNKSSSKIIIEKGDAIIILVEDYPCESRDQAKSREAYYVLNNPCVNKCVPGRTQKGSVKVYQNKHKEEIKNQMKEYYLDNMEQLKEYKK